MKLPTNYLPTNYMNVYLNVCKQITYVKLSLLHKNTWNHLTKFKKWAQPRLKCYQQKVFINHIYVIYMYK